MSVNESGRAFRALGYLAAMILGAVAIQFLPTPKPKSAVTPRPRLCIDKAPRVKPKGLAFSTPPVERAALASDKRWNNGTTLRIAFQLGTQAQRDEVMKAAGIWEAVCGIKFVQTDVDPAEVRVTFNETDGSWSFVGRDILSVDPNEATLNIGWPDDLARSVHELGHTLGLIHEHQSPVAGNKLQWNLPAVLAFYEAEPNRWTQAEVYEQVINRYSGPVMTNSAYDPKSVMMYPIDGSLLIDKTQATGWNQTLSAEDKALIGTWYPR